jgi:hypothetical protein
MSHRVSEGEPETIQTKYIRVPERETVISKLVENRSTNVESCFVPQ